MPRLTSASMAENISPVVRFNLSTHAVRDTTQQTVDLAVKYS
jgi:hypothetical protein